MAKRGLAACYALSFAASVMQVLYLPAVSLYLSELGFGAGEVGLLSGGAALLYAVGAAGSGLVLWRAGSRWMAAASLVLMAAAYGAMAAAGGWAAVAAVGLGMLSFSLFWPSVELGVAAGGGGVRWFSFSWSLGTVVGSLGAALLFNVDLRALFTAFSLASAAMAAAAVYIPERRGGGVGLGDIGRLWRTWVGAFTYAASLGAILVYYPLYVEAYGVAEYAASLLLFSILSSRTLAFSIIGERRAAPWIAPILLGAGALIPFVPLQLLVVVGVCVGVGEALIYGVALSGALEGGEAAYTGLFEASIGLGYAAGPMIGGIYAGESLSLALSAPALLAAVTALPLAMGRRG